MPDIQEDARKTLEQELERYRAFDEHEESARQRFLEFVRREERCFDRDTLEGHVTASAWVLNRAADKVLLSHHRKLNMWVHLGGHVEGESALLSVALREAFEESGLSQLVPHSPQIFDIDVLYVPPWRHTPEHLHYDVRYLLQCGGEESVVVSDESHDLAWVPLQELHRYTTEESLHRMARKVLRQWGVQSERACSSR